MFAHCGNAIMIVTCHQWANHSGYDQGYVPMSQNLFHHFSYALSCLPAGFLVSFLSFFLPLPFFFFLACKMIHNMWKYINLLCQWQVPTSPGLLVRRRAAFAAAAAAWRALVVNRVEQKLNFCFFTVHFTFFIKALVLLHRLNRWFGQAVTVIYKFI